MLEHMRPDFFKRRKVQLREPRAAHAIPEQVFQRRAVVIVQFGNVADDRIFERQLSFRDEHERERSGRDGFGDGRDVVDRVCGNRYSAVDSSGRNDYRHIRTN